MTIDLSSYATSGKINPAARAESITTSDTDMNQFSQAIYVGGAGDLHVIMAHEYAIGGTTVVIFTNVPAGSVLPIRCAQVRLATTATNIVALF